MTSAILTTRYICVDLLSSRAICAHIIHYMFMCFLKAYKMISIMTLSCYYTHTEYFKLLHNSNDEKTYIFFLAPCI